MDSGEPQISPDLKNTVAEFRAFLKMELGRSANTVASYTSDVAQFAAFLHARKIESFADVDADSLVEWISGIARNTKASTQSRKLSAMKSLAGFLVDERVWSKNYCDLVARPKLRRNIPEILSAGEVARLLEAPPTDTPEGLRDRAMLELMYSSGLRVSELCGIRESDIDVAERILRVVGKGSKTRLVPVGAYALAAISAYKAARRDILGGAEVPELFVTRRGGKISRKTFWYNIKRYAIAAGIEKNVKPHSAPFVRDPPAAKRRKSDVDTRNARAQRPFHNADLHEPPQRRNLRPARKKTPALEDGRSRFAMIAPRLQNVCD